MDQVHQDSSPPAPLSSSHSPQEEIPQTASATDATTTPSPTSNTTNNSATTTTITSSSNPNNIHNNNKKGKGKGKGKGGPDNNKFRAQLNLQPSSSSSNSSSSGHGSNSSSSSSSTQTLRSLLPRPSGFAFTFSHNNRPTTSNTLPASVSAAASSGFVPYGVYPNNLLVQNYINNSPHQVLQVQQQQQYYHHHQGFVTDPTRTTSYQNPDNYGQQHQQHPSMSSVQHQHSSNYCVLYDDINSLLGSVSSSLFPSTQLTQQVVAPVAVDPVGEVGLGSPSVSMWPLTSEEDQYPPNIWDYVDPFLFDF
ncbi:ethylene-responsive transcription factor ABI4 [Quillaja saponaria]|uniref:Ethylene-responsive transcription factor ABI4 n=1 Tax=Quillaja saponaria TaxID=32244 RepID=A0AAD7PQB3_QUISA|nr:ethylene-responsive transcription factor ABI4 [Quillaja saponaria]